MNRYKMESKIHKFVPGTAVDVNERYRGLLRRDCPCFSEGYGKYSGLGMCSACLPHPAFQSPNSPGPGLAHCETCPWHDKKGVLAGWQRPAWNVKIERRRHDRPVHDLPPRMLKRWQTDKVHLLEALNALGLGAGDVIQIHSSLGNLGSVDGGPAAVVEALLECVGSGGTVFNPVFVVDKPVDCGECRPKDFCTSGRQSEMGAISEAFRQRAGAVRSCARIAPFCGIGPDADVLKTQKDAATQCGKGSVFEWLYRLDAYILCIGVGVNSITGFHYPEEVMEIPNVGIFDATVPRMWYAPMGRRINYTYPLMMEEMLRSAGILRTVRSGFAVLHCLPAVEFFDFLMAGLTDDPTCLHLYPARTNPGLFPDAAQKAARMLEVWRNSGPARD